MRSADVKAIAYCMNKSKLEGNGAIVFLGAGASKSANIPLAGEICQYIITEYPENPNLKKLSSNQKKNYLKIMDCLSPAERKEIFRKCIDNAHMSMTYLYLAQLLKEKYVEYILTVNFDDLMIKGAAYLGEFPPIYDLPVLRELNTTVPDKGSIIYLHGRYNCVWQLNTKEEMSLVNGACPALFRSIMDRPWIFIGYSGNDLVFSHIKKLGRFDKNLYWITPDKKYLSNKVTSFLEKLNSNCFLCDKMTSDDFMVKLHQELKIQRHPLPIQRPFSYLSNFINSIELPEEGSIESSVIEMLSNTQLKVAEIAISIECRPLFEQIEKFTQMDIPPSVSDIEKLTQDAILLPYERLYQDFAEIYMQLGIYFLQNKHYPQSLKFLTDAVRFNPFDPKVHIYVGKILAEYGKLTKDINLYKESIDAYQNAVELDPNLWQAYAYWANTLRELALKTRDKVLFWQSLELFGKSAVINPDNGWIYHEWGNCWLGLARLHQEEKFYRESFMKFAKSIEIDPSQPATYLNWGNALQGLATLSNDKNLFVEAVNKYRLAIKADPEFIIGYQNLAFLLLHLSVTEENEEFGKEGSELLLKSINMGGSYYRFACHFAENNDKKNALYYLNLSVDKKELMLEAVMTDERWVPYQQDPEFIDIMKKIKLHPIYPSNEID